jgi:hypothetical protein
MASKARNIADLLDSNGDVQADALDTQPQLGRRNLIINGGFDVWQRGTSGSFTTGPTYVSADRWSGYVNSSTTVTMSRQAFATGQTEVPNNPKYYARFDWLGTGSSVFFSMSQRIEGVQHGAGGTITLSFYARTEQGDNITVGINQKFGSGGSSDVTVTNTPIDTTSSWQKHVVTVDVPSIAGKTIGTGDNLEITFYRTGTLNSYLDIANVQLELGSVATPFEHRSYGEELALCQRYYQHSVKLKANSLFWTGTGGYYGGPTYLLPTTMRVNPSITKVADATFSWASGSTEQVSHPNVTVEATQNFASFHNNVTGNEIYGCQVELRLDAEL